MSKEAKITADGADPVATDPERGLLASCREWVDLLPWIRLFRVMRLLGSPVLVSFTLLVLLIWYHGATWILEGEFRRQIRSTQTEIGLKETTQVFSQVGRLGYKLHPSSIVQFPDRLSSLRWWAASLWTVLLWLPLGLFLMRQGLMLTVGRELESLLGWWKIALRRSWPAFCSVVGVLVGPLLMALLLWFLHAISGLLPNHMILQFPLALAAAFFAGLGGLLLLSSYFAIPLSLVSIVAEPHPDAIDAVSRGYESCFRRPLRLMSYLAIVIVLLVIAFLIATGIASCARGVLTLGGGTQPNQWSSLMGDALVFLSVLPTAFVTTLAWGLVGGVYLLLRRDTCEHEIEDIWMPVHRDSVAVEELSGLADLNIVDNSESS